MASKTVDIVVNVRDAASAPLKRISKGVSDAGKSAKDASVNFTEFNRVMFSTTAFVGLFSVAFNKLAQGMLEASKFDRITTQFEKTVGPKGELFKLISQMTDNSIDRIEALRAGIALKSLGVAENMSQIADFVARAGTAGKMAGLESAEGIKRFTDFMRSGSISHLSFLNLIQQTNGGLKMTEAILSKYGGIAGSAMSAAARLAIGQNLLKTATQGSLKGQRDYADTLLDVGQAFDLTKKEASLLLVAAFNPILEKVKDLLFYFSDFTEKIRKTDKEILFLVKSLGLAITGLGSFIAVAGTTRLVLMALTKLGAAGSVPVLTAAVVGLGLAFISTTHGANGLMERLKIFGAVFQGSFELISSFIEDPENFAKGIGKIDKSVADLLRKHGLLELVTQIARVGASIALFVRGVVDGFTETMHTVINTIGVIGKKILTLLGIDPGAWSRFWVEGVENIGRAVGKLSVGILAAVAAFKAFKLAKNVLGSLPIIGNLFGGGKGGLGCGGGPKGTAGDPLWVKMATGVASAIGGMPLVGSLIDKIKGFSNKPIISKITLGKGILGSIIGGLGFGLLFDKMIELFTSAEEKDKETTQKIQNIASNSPIINTGDVNVEAPKVPATVVNMPKMQQTVQAAAPATATQTAPEKQESGISTAGSLIGSIIGMFAFDVLANKFKGLGRTFKTAATQGATLSEAFKSLRKEGFPAAEALKRARLVVPTMAEKLGAGLGATLDSLSIFGMRVGNIGKIFPKIGSIITSPLKLIGSLISSPLKTSKNIITGSLGLLGRGARVGGSVLSSIAKGVGIAFATVIAVLPKLGSIISSVTKGLVIAAPAIARVSGVLTLLYYAGAALVGMIKGVIDSFDKLKGIAEAVWFSLKFGFEDLKNKIIAAGTSAYNWITGVASNIGSAFSAAFNNIINKVKQIPGVQAVGDAFMKATDAVKSFVGFIGKMILQAYESISNLPIIGEAMKGLFEGVKTISKSLVDFAMDPGEFVRKGVGAITDFAQANVEAPARAGIAERASGELMKGIMPEMTANLASPEARLKQLQQTQAGLEGAQKQRFTEALMAAQDAASKSGQTVTPEEFQRIMEYTLGKATDPMLKEMQKTSENTTKSEATSQRKRGC